ncbi:KH domain protein, partial [Teladorsagia circumcincta]
MNVRQWATSNAEANKIIELKENAPTEENAKIFGYRSKLIKIPLRSVGSVLGRGGTNIRAIERETKTFMKVLHYGKQNGGTNIINRIRGNHSAGEWTPKEGHNPARECEFAFVEIRGETDENIRLAISEINSVVADSTIPRLTRHVCVPSHVLGYVIGKGGANLREIKQNHGVRVEIGPETGSHTRKISITGSEKSITLAEARINQLMSHHYCDNNADGTEEYER